MTKEQKEACEALALKIYAYDWHSGVDQNSGPRYGFESGFEAAQTPEMLMLNPLVRGLVEALSFHKAGQAYYRVGDEAKTVADLTEKVLAPFKEVEK